jgi:hypothetical protein
LIKSIVTGLDGDNAVNLEEAKIGIPTMELIKALEEQLPATGADGRAGNLFFFFSKIVIIVEMSKYFSKL